MFSSFFFFSLIIDFLFEVPIVSFLLLLSPLRLSIEIFDYGKERGNINEFLIESLFEIEPVFLLQLE